METDAGDYKIGDGKVAVAAAPPPKSAVPAPSSYTVPAKLEPILLLGKSAKGASASGLITQATGTQGVFVFSEILALPGVKDLATHEQYASNYHLLEIFAYGTWGDYVAKQASLPKLTKAQEFKLKQLSILSLAMKGRVIPYQVLLTELQLPDIPTLEDLLIEAFYSNLLTGRLDQREARLEVIFSIGRDVRPSSLSQPSAVEAPPAPAAPETKEDSMDLDVAPPVPPKSTEPSSHSVESLTLALTGWLSTIGQLLQSLDRHLGKLAADDLNDIQVQQAHEKAVRAMVEEVSTVKEKEKEKKDGGSGAGGWISSAAPILGRFMGGGGGGSSASAGGNKDDMDVDGPAAGGSGLLRGVKSPSGAAGRTRKRGRM